MSSDGVSLRHYLEYDPSTWSETGRGAPYSIEEHIRKFHRSVGDNTRIGLGILVSAFESEPKEWLTFTQHQERLKESLDGTGEVKVRACSSFVLDSIGCAAFLHEGIIENCIDIQSNTEGNQIFMLTNGGYYYCKKLIEDESKRGRGRKRNRSFASLGRLTNPLRHRLA